MQEPENTIKYEDSCNPGEPFPVYPTVIPAHCTVEPDCDIITIGDDSSDNEDNSHSGDHDDSSDVLVIEDSDPELTENRLSMDSMSTDQLNFQGKGDNHQQLSQMPHGRTTALRGLGSHHAGGGGGESLQEEKCLGAHVAVPRWATRDPVRLC
ncbi:hypothetical protein MC885_014441 [Smutsia gigantea]|nr:hypothetical protein MC885_014441 [Smutsia gigantea]